MTKANQYLATEAGKPRLDTGPLKAQIRENEEAIKKLFERIEGLTDESLCQAYEKRIGDLQKELNERKARLREASAQNVATPPPLDAASVKALLSDLRGLLNQEIPAAAEAVRALTGPITIRQEKTAEKKRGARWIATFSPDLLGWLRGEARGKDCPDSISLEYLNSRIWITPESVEAMIDPTPKYEKISGRVAELTAKGCGINTICNIMRESWETVKQAQYFAKTGRRPTLRSRKSGRRGKGGIPRKQIDVAEVVQMRDVMGYSFRKIGRMLGVCDSTVARAYDKGNPQPLQEAIESGRIRRGYRSQLGSVMFERIREGLHAGKSIKEVASEIGCGRSTVHRVRTKMRLVDRDGSDGSRVKAKGS